MIKATAEHGPEIAPGDRSFTAPYGFDVGGLIPSIAALPAQRHMDLYGTTEEQFGAHVVDPTPPRLAQRGCHLPGSRSPSTTTWRRATSPSRSGSSTATIRSTRASAVIFTAGDRARDWRKKPVWVEAAGLLVGEVLRLRQHRRLNQNSPFHAARELWSRTDLTPGDVDFAQLYDGFTIIVFQWLEALGFCPLGESGPFVEAGNTRLGGKTPVNTDGGACNVGRRHGANFCIESVRQLRGECGPRQVPDAEVGVWANAVGPFSGVVLMTAD